MVIHIGGEPPRNLKQINAFLRAAQECDGGRFRSINPGVNLQVTSGNRIPCKQMETSGILHLV